MRIIGCAFIEMIRKILHRYQYCLVTSPSTQLTYHIDLIKCPEGVAFCKRGLFGAKGEYLPLPKYL